jgi:serine/threonine protein kinase
MPVRIETRAEPIPGYKLIDRLGGGGFGEVWRAEAPGGLHKAIKFVYGDLQDAGEDGVRACQELKALTRVKSVRHPYILSLERFDIVDGQLLIVMELADRSLWDRYKEYKAQGLKGIPREELLQYMEETAEALDLMNVEYQLQHLDIKPQNLFLVHNHIKVADFGLVKDLEGMMASVTGGVTPVYAAPETFEGWISRFSDQYSLAIVYQELLTGQRPFAGTNIRHLVLQHLQGTPDVSALPLHDRPIIARCLAKKPDERFPNCLEMVRALSKATARPKAQTVLDIKTPGPGETAEGAQADAAAADVQEYEEGLNTPPESLFNPATHCMGAQGELGWQPEVVPVRQAPAPETGDGVLFPALIIGLGQQGLNVLQHLREGLHDQFGSLDPIPHLRFLHIDTDPGTLLPATRTTPARSLASTEVILARLSRPSHYLRGREGKSAFESWLSPKMLYRITRTQLTAGMRALGRLAFCDNYRVLIRRLRQELEACTDPGTLTKAIYETKLGLRSNTPRVYIVTSLAGGTGSGMFIDTAYVVRTVLKELGYGLPEVHGLFLLPAVDDNPNHLMAIGNAFAALTELCHFSTAGNSFTARYEEKKPPIRDSNAPFNRSVVVPLPEEHTETALNEVTGMAAEHLRRELTSLVGRTADLCRMGVASPSPRDQEFTVDTISVARFHWPWRRLRCKISQELCRRLVDRWMSKDASALSAPVRARIDQQVVEQELAPYRLLGMMETVCEEDQGRPPAEVLAELAEPFLQSAAPPDEQGIMGVLNQIDKIIGRVDDDAVGGQGPYGLAAVLREKAEPMAFEWSLQLAQLPGQLVEEPGFRLAGAEEAVRHLVAITEQSLQKHEAAARGATARATEALHKIQGLLTTLQKGPPAGKRIATFTTELVEHLRGYSLARLESMILQRVCLVHISLRGNLSDQLREVSYCRARLTELRRSFSPPESANSDAQPKTSGHMLYPDGCKTFEDTFDKLMGAIGAEELEQLDQHMQVVISQHFRSLLEICLAPGSRLHLVKRSMEKEAETFAGACFDSMDSAEMFNAQFPEEHAATQEIRTAYDETTPELAGPELTSDNHFSLIAVPKSSAGDRFFDRARMATEAELARVDSNDDIVFYRESPGVPLSRLQLMGPDAQDAYRQMTAAEAFTPHSRIDISEWKVAAG